MTAPSSGYQRRLGVFDATMLVIGGIIGAGIFLNPAVVAQRVASPWLAIGVWVAGGAVALTGALCFAELGARKPEAGGGYVYLRDAWGPLTGFLYGWTELLVINSGGIAAVAVTFASYAVALVGLPTHWIAPLAVSAIALLSVVNYLGIRPGSVVQNVLTVGKLAALAALVVAGLIWAARPAAGGIGGGHDNLGAFAAALVPVLFAYGGWQSTNFVAGELRNPVRDLPRALVLGVVAVVTTYVLANIAYVRVLGIGGLAHSTAPASDVMRVALGPAGATLIGIGIAVSTLGFLNLAILSAPRVYQAMAADGVFFGRVAALHRRYHVPAAALLVQAAWAILLVASKTYGQLLDYVVFGDWIFFGLVGATVWHYRRRGVGDPGGFRIPGHPWVTMFFVGAAAYAVVGSVASNPLNALFGTGVIATGIPFFLWWRSRSVQR